jgi:tRNA threonylcarbamoyl adenosine modification protein YeaZ
MSSSPKYTLAIETATQNGSLSLLKDGEEIGHWVGDGITTVSVEILPQISGLLDLAGVTINDIDLLAVSAGPGSFTGVRIGLSIAKGLQTASNIAAAAIPLTKALALCANDKSNAETACCLIPSGRGEAYWQRYNKTTAVTEVVSSKIDEIVEALRVDAAFCIAALGLKDEYIAQIESGAGNKVHIADGNLAKYIGKAALNARSAGAPSGELLPMYVKNFNAGR